jgi:hypothetical protein
VVIDIHHERTMEVTVVETSFPIRTISRAAKMLPAAPPPGRIRLREKAPIETWSAWRGLIQPP